MARQGRVQNYHNFSAGIITEQSLLQQQEGIIVRDALNFDFLPNGEAHLRKGVELEEGITGPQGFLPDFIYTTAPRRLFTFENIEAGNVSNVSVAVLRAGRTLRLFELYGSGSLTNRMKAVFGETGSQLPVVSTNQPLDIVKVQGRMVVLQPTSVRWIYQDDTGVWRLSENIVSMDSATFGGAMVRDFVGIPDGVPQDERRAGPLTDVHRYNLLNQGWDDDKIQAYYAAAGLWPSNSQVWHEGKDTEDEFSPEQLDKLNFGNSPAARGRAIISAISLDRRSVFPGSNSGLPPPVLVNSSSPYLYSTAAAAGDRVAFSGCDVESAARKVFISPVLKNLSTYASTSSQVITTNTPGVVVRGTMQGIYWSEDGVNWTQTNIASGTWISAAYSPELGRFVAISGSFSGTFAAGSANPQVTSSSDGKTWTTPTSIGIASFRSSGYNPAIAWSAAQGRFAAIGTGIAVSSNGTSWTAVSSNVADFRSIAWSPTLAAWFAVNGSGIWRSTTLVTWELVHASTGFNTIRWGANRLVAIPQRTGSANLSSRVSTDGINWTTSPVGLLGYVYTGLAFSSDTQQWIAAAHTPGTANQRLRRSPASGLSWSAGPSGNGVGSEWTDVVWLSGANRWIAVAQQNVQAAISSDGTSWSDTQGNLALRSACLEVKPPQTVVVDTVEDTFFFDTVFKFYQQNDPTAELSSELLADDGVTVELTAADSIRKLASIHNVWLVLASNGVWAISGLDIQTGFRSDEFTIYKITNRGCRYPDTVIEAGDVVYFWGDAGICAIGLNEGGRLVATNISENTYDDIYTGISTEARQHAIAYYDQFADRVYWAYGDNDPAIGTIQDRCNILQLEKATGALSRYKLPPMRFDTEEQETMAVSVIGFTQDIGQESTTPSLKFIVERRGMGVQSYHVMELRGEDFLDYGSILGVSPTPYSAYIETWPDAVGQTVIKKQVPWVHTYMRKTEEGFVDNGDGLEPVRPSGCIMQAQWDWHNSAAGKRWSRPRQIYRHKRFYIPENEEDTFDTGEEVVFTQNKIFGRGNSVAFRFEAEPGKDCQLLGYSVIYTADAESK